MRGEIWMERDERGSDLQKRSLPKLKQQLSQEFAMQWRDLTEYQEE
jgi:hypothetical protein